MALLLKIEISSNGQNCSILSQNVPKFELCKHNDELFSIHYRIFYEHGQLKFHPPLFLFLAWQPSWLEVGITGHNFGRGPSKDHSTKVWLQLAQWFLSRRLKCEMLTDGLMCCFGNNLLYMDFKPIKILFCSY
jgi:hypothetical protein